MTKMDYEKYELIKLKSLDNKIIGASLTFFGIVAARSSFDYYRTRFVFLLILVIILIYYGISLLYKRVYLSGNQIKVINFLKKTKIYNISDLYIEHNKSFTSNWFSRTSSF